MRTLTLFLGLAAITGCAKPDKPAAGDATPGALGAGATMTTISLAAVAGNWSMRTTSDSSDTVLLTYGLSVSADGTNWTLTFPNRPPVAARVQMAGDSIVAETGPYESALRAGVQVTTHTVFRLEGQELVGTGTAHYTVEGPDSLLRLRMRGTRTP